MNTAETIEINMFDITTLKSLIANAQSICLVGHRGPDGDAIGSTTGFARCLRAAHPNTKVQVVLPDDCPRTLLRVPGAKDILIHRHVPKEAEAAITQADLICCMDFQEAKRVGSLLAPTLIAAKAPKVLIDHHLDPDRAFFALSFSYPPLSSTAELTHRIITALGFAQYIDADVATSILTGIITDTGCFSFSSEYSGVFEIAADLINRGARKVDIINDCFHSLRTEQFRLRGYALGTKLHILPEIHTAYFTLNANELLEYNATANDTEGFVNAPLDMEGIHYSIFLREQGDEIKISFRSTGHYTVNDLAYNLFGGGGHKNAAGAECAKENGLEQTALRIVQAIKDRHTQNC